MNPDEKDFLLLAAYHDGELSPGETLDMERRLREDPSLQSMRNRLQTLSASVRHVVAETSTPPGLRAAIGAKFANVEVLAPPRERWRRREMAAVLLFGLVCGGTAGYGLSRMSAEPDATRLVDAVYTGHLRGLAAPQPFDIASSDRHVVKPWFNGRTAIAPDAPDLAVEGYPLAGGRVDIVRGMPVPTLVYRRRQHVISVTAIPRTGEMTAGGIRREGTTIEQWDVGDLTYLVISDLNAKELGEFIALFRSRAAPRSSDRTSLRHD